MSNIFVPMTKATGLGSLPVLLESGAGTRAVDREFQKAGLPTDIIEFRDTYIPLSALRVLFDNSARAFGDRCFGLTVGQNMMPASFGLWLEYCAQAPSLIKGLRRAVNCAKFHQSGGYLSFSQTRPFSFFRYHAAPSFSTTAIQHIDHLIGPSINLVRSFLGPDWQPEWIDVNYPRDPLAHQFEQKLGLPVRYGQPAMGIPIRHCDLEPKTRPSCDAGNTIAYSEVCASENNQHLREPVGSVFSVITLRLLEGKTDIEGAACRIGVGVRKLQRDLRREGVEYRDLLERAKRNRAQSLLQGTNLPVTEIALSLGYSDHANFTRAFRRMSGMAPDSFRKQNASLRI